jgi:hypothetical protein
MIGTPNGLSGGQSIPIIKPGVTIRGGIVRQALQARSVRYGVSLNPDGDSTRRGDRLLGAKLCHSMR